MNNREIVYRSLDIIEEQLRGGMTVQDLADRLGYSVYYFMHLFKGITGQSPGSYIGRRRITSAWEDLQRGPRKVIDLALEYGFGSPESFSRAFRNQLGANPSAVTSGREVDSGGLQSRLYGDRLERLRTVGDRTPELVEFGPLKLIGLSLFYGPEMPDDLSAPWKTLVDNRDAIKSRIRPERHYQVQYWLPNRSFETIFFLLALEAEDLSDIPIQFTAKSFARQHYLRFRHHGPANTVDRTYEYIYRSYLPETDYGLPHLYNFEYYPPDYRGPYDEESISEVYIPVSLRPEGGELHSGPELTV